MLNLNGIANNEGYAKNGHNRTFKGSNGDNVNGAVYKWHVWHGVVH